MKRKALILIPIVLAIAAGLFYYRRHHYSRVAQTFTSPADPYQMTHPVPSSSLNHTLQTIQEINQINKLNQEQNKPSSSTQRSSK